MAADTKMHSITLPRARLRRLAKILLNLAPPMSVKHAAEPLIKVVCISDTHNHQPKIPPGDLLLHAGDLSEWGSFAEIQKQLSWLSSQPHTHKVIIAGNHDVLFDQSFLDLNKDRFPIEQGQTAADLDFGSVIYLQDSSTILDFPVFGRKCTIYGSPWTPKYVNSAFQYSRDDDIWAKRILKETDILLTHGPPYGHLDGLLRHGCRYLATAIEKQRPKLVVFGHIHAAYGRENVRYDGLRKLYEDIERGWSGWEVITAMFALLVWARMSFALGLRKTD